MALLPQPTNVGQDLRQAVMDFNFDGPPKTDEQGLALVLQGANRCEAFLTTRLWMSEWRVAKALYEAPVKQDYWRDTLVPRAANQFPIVAQHCRAILDAVMPALFPDNPPFDVDPTTGTPRQVARAWEAILAYQLRDCGFKQQIRLVAKDAEIYGTGIGKWGWEYYTRTRKIYRRTVPPIRVPSMVKGMPDRIIHTKESDESIEAVTIEEQVSRPYFDRIEVNHVLVDPGLREPDIRKSKFVIYRAYKSLRQLNDLRDQEGWDIPSENYLKSLVMPPTENAPAAPALENEATTYPTQGHKPLPRYIDSSKDPLDHLLEVLEYWTDDYVICVLDRKKVIRKELNPLGKIPFVSCYWDDIPGCFYSFGIPRRIGGVQTHVQGLRNGRLDDIHLNLQMMLLARKGSFMTSQPIKQYPGSVLKVDDIEKDLKPFERQPVLQEAYKEEEVLIADAEKTTGANEMLVQGAQPGGIKSTGMRTSAGAQMIGGAASSRIQSFVECIIDQVFLPVLYSFLHMSREMLDPSEARKIVGATLWQEIEQKHMQDGGTDLTIEMANSADIELTMLAGSSIAARNKLAQSLPLEMQMFSQPGTQQGLQTAGMKVNWVELARRVEQAAGWKSYDDIIIPMSDQDKQALMQSNPAVINAKATQQRLQQQHANKSAEMSQEHGQKLQQIDAQGMANAGETVLVKSLERAQEKAEIPQLAGGFQG